jgi:adenylate cyclase
VSEGEDQGPGEGAETGADGITERVAAILAADAVGYSRLMADDEQATVKTLDQARDIFRRHVDANRGRVVDTAGDSVLAVFETTSGAVRASMAIQEGLQALNADTPSERHMQFRIGIHLGDIMEKVSDGTIYGDGVNVAARLEALSKPGGITVSGSVHESIRDRVDVGFAFLGEHEGKNLKTPVKAYRVLAEGEDPEKPKSKPRIPLTGAIAAAIAAIVVVAGVVWWQVQEPESPQMVDAEGTPTDDPVLAMPTGPSIAVLPFDNLSGDPEQEYFVDGLTAELITTLSRFRNLRVTARNSTFQYKGQSVDVREVGKALNVNYVVEGSVRIDNAQVRVSAQLLDSASGSHLWSESYEEDRSATGIFSIQDSITEKIVASVASAHGIISFHETTLRNEAGANELDSYACVLRAHQFSWDVLAESYRRARDCLMAAVEREPEYAEAWAWLGSVHMYGYAMGYNAEPNSLELAIEAAQRAFDIDPRNQIALNVLAQTRYYLKEYELFYPLAEQAVALNPNNPAILGALGQAMAWADRWDIGVAWVKKAMALNPNFPGWLYHTLFYEHYRTGDYARAKEIAEKLVYTDLHYTYVMRAAVYGQLGDSDRAKKAAERLLELYPDYQDAVRDDLGIWFASDQLIEHMVEGLEKAGLFDEPEPPSRPVIAVLPFDNLSGDPEQEYFADGVTEDIITRLAKFNELGVIARNSSFQYRGQSVDIRQVGEDLGATFVLEGSIRRTADQIRVAAQLSDAQDGTHLWAETYDSTLTAGEIFAVQDEITAAIAATVGDPMSGAFTAADMELARRAAPENLQAYECVLRAHDFFRSPSTEMHSEVRGCLEETLQADGDYADAWAYLGAMYATEHAYQYNKQPEPLARALEAGLRAVELAPDNQLARLWLSRTYFLRKEPELFFAEAGRVLSLNPGNASAKAATGMYLAYAGQWERGVALVKEAMALNPRHQNWYYNAIWVNHLRLGDDEAALRTLEKIDAPNYWAYQQGYAAIYAHLGRFDEARAALDRMLKLRPEAALDPRANIELWQYDHMLVERWLEGLALAGLEIPESVDTLPAPVE